MNDVEDGELLLRARRGNEEAFSHLFARHERAIYRYAAYICGQDAADDIVQETFLVILRQQARVDAPQGTLQGYLLGIARHIALKRLAVQKADLDAELLLSPGDPMLNQPPTPLDAMTQREAVESMRTAVNALPLVYREVIVLCDLQDMDYATAAEALEVPVGTLRSRLHRARALLGRKLATRPSVRRETDDDAGT
jgi:RNA polymerase sigma-70 factor, ECF subfamily